MHFIFMVRSKASFYNLFLFPIPFSKRNPSLRGSILVSKYYFIYVLISLYFTLQAKDSEPPLHLWVFPQILATIIIIIKYNGSYDTMATYTTWMKHNLLWISMTAYVYCSHYKQYQSIPPFKYHKIFSNYRVSLTSFNINFVALC